MDLNREQIIAKINKIKEQEKTLNVKIFLYEKDIYNDRQDAMWYGGEIGRIEYGKYSIFINVYGDVRVWLLKNGEEIARSKDTGNNGAFFQNMKQYIKNDTELWKMGNAGTSEGYTLEIENNNWLEFEIYDNEKRLQINDGWDSLIENNDVLEAFEDIEYYINMIKDYEKENK